MERRHARRRAPLRRLLVLVLLVVGLLGLEAEGAGATHTVEHRFGVQGGFPVTWDDGSPDGCTGTSTDVPPPAGENFTLVYPSPPTLGAFGDHPVVVFGAGTNLNYSDAASQRNSNCSYKLGLERLASWGFVVVAYNDGQVGSGQELIEAANVALLLDAWDTPGNPFFDNLDTTSMAATGHSQGAIGAINATRNGGGRFESVMAMSTPNRSFLSNYNSLLCNAPCVDIPVPTSTNGLGAPIFFVRGTGLQNPFPCNQDDGFSNTTAADWYPAAPHPYQAGTVHVTPPQDPLTCLSTSIGYPHNDLSNALGYMTAWLMYTLVDNPNARPAFVGTAPELTESLPHWEGVSRRGLT